MHLVQAVGSGSQPDHGGPQQGLELSVPVEPSTTASSTEPSVPVEPSSTEPSFDTAAPDQQSPEFATFPDVPDPIFEAPWFPCPEGDYPEHTVVVKTHDEVVHTSSSTQIDAEVELPEGSFKAIALRVEHECPTGGVCDLYDRRAVIELVNQTDAGELDIALMRYVTTYRFVAGKANHMCSWTDVTAYASLLTGRQTIRSWLDTVVSPGDELGDGWQVSASLVFYPGAAPDPVQIEELYGRFIDIGEGPGSLDEQTPPMTVEIPPNVTKVVAQLTVSGHGWGPEDTDNCAVTPTRVAPRTGDCPAIYSPWCGSPGDAPMQRLPCPSALCRLHRHWETALKSHERPRS